jgi:N-hydroxyarylamine O-acetyltransferase
VVVIDDADVDAYLARLGQEREPPSPEALFSLHGAQVERVPYETLWIQLGEAGGIDPEDSLRRIAHGRRGGYCLHLNGAFGALLDALGYDVTRHVGGVHGPLGADEREMTNHLVLLVRGLPTDDHPPGTWYVDAGLGDALHEPLPLAAGSYRQGPFALRLDETPGEVGDWHLTHDPAGGFAGMAWRAAVTGMDAFADRHVEMSTSPQSGFVRVLTAQRRDAAGVDILRGLSLKRLGDQPVDVDLGTPTELFDVLGDVFGLTVEPAARAGLWSRVQRTHEDWVAAGRP